MFPGDSFSYAYDVDVSFKNSVTVSMKISVRDGYEKLAEVLKFKVENLAHSSTLYDGTAKELPAKWDKVLVTTVADGETVRTTYSITAYLDKSVGNDYQNLPLVADFTWEVADYEPLGIGEEKELKVLIHMPEECGNEAQSQAVTFDMNVDAVQSVNNPDKEL